MFPTDFQEIAVGTVSDGGVSVFLVSKVYRGNTVSLSLNTLQNQAVYQAAVASEKNKLPIISKNKVFTKVK